MTSLPTAQPGARKLGLVIDLDTCVGCHACAVSCKEWNAFGQSGPLTDFAPYGVEPSGVWLNRVHTFELGEGEDGRTVYFPKNCFHCEEPDCVTVCPTGASYKRGDDGIVLVDPALCIGCKLCSWACPYGAREFDDDDGVMKKCTLCVDRIYDQDLSESERMPACVAACPTSARHFGDFADPDSTVSKLVAARGGVDAMPEMGYRPVSKYLSPRSVRASLAPVEPPPYPSPRARESRAGETGNRFLQWIDRFLSNRPA